MRLVFAFISLLASSSLYASSSNDSKPEFEMIRKVQLNPSTWFVDYKNHKTGKQLRNIYGAAGSYWEDPDGGRFLGTSNEPVYDMLELVDLQRKEYGKMKRKRVEKEEECLQEENHEISEDKSEEMSLDKSEEQCECEQEKKKTRIKKSSFEPTCL